MMGWKDKCKLIMGLAAVICFAAMYPRLSYVEGICSVVNENGEQVDGSSILTASANQIQISFGLFDLNY
ncbi:MAG: hypothetical protein PHY47_10385 [Lachnospiraceae bacterium]|nr:hypothetical protein [Lachnospiraceae bacterium]